MNQIIELKKLLTIQNIIQKKILILKTQQKKQECHHIIFIECLAIFVGLSPTEYIRNRRLSLAADELIKNNSNVLDIAIKYQFGSNESFTRAFTKFHNVTPKMAKVNGTKLKSFSPIHLKLEVEGGKIMDYKIIEKENFEISALMRDFDLENKEKIPEFWGRN